MPETESIRASRNGERAGAAIYGLLDTARRRFTYVGRSTDLPKRLNEHARTGRSVDAPVVLEECDARDASDREISWIRLLHQCGHPLTNRIAFKAPIREQAHKPFSQRALRRVLRRELTLLMNPVECVRLPDEAATAQAVLATVFNEVPEAQLFSKYILHNLGRYKAGVLLDLFAEFYAERYPSRAATYGLPMAIEQIGSQPDSVTAERKRAFAGGIVAGLASSARCQRCGRKLTDPNSKALGIGPDCLERFGGTESWRTYISALTDAHARVAEVRTDG